MRVLGWVWVGVMCWLSLCCCVEAWVGLGAIGSDLVQLGAFCFGAA